MSLALQHPENRLLTRGDKVSHSEPFRNSEFKSECHCCCVCVCFPGCFSSPPPPSHRNSCHSLTLLLCNSCRMENCLFLGTCNAERGVCRLPAFTKQGGYWEEAVEGMPKFCTPNLSKPWWQRYFRFWRLFLLTIRVLFLVGLLLSLAGHWGFSSVASCFLLGSSRSSHSSGVFVANSF